MEPYLGKEKQVNFSIDNLTIVGNLKMPELIDFLLKFTGVCDTSQLINDGRKMFEISFKVED